MILSIYHIIFWQYTHPLFIGFYVHAHIVGILLFEERQAEYRHLECAVHFLIVEESLAVDTEGILIICFKLICSYGFEIVCQRIEQCRYACTHYVIVSLLCISCMAFRREMISHVLVWKMLSSVCDAYHMLSPTLEQSLMLPSVWPWLLWWTP